MAVLFVISAILFLMWHEEKIKKDFVKQLESRFERRIEYRNYCGVLHYSYNDNKFYCKLAGIEEISQNQITGERFSNFRKTTEENFFETESRTESGALELFYIHVDLLLDNKPTYLDDDDLLCKFAEDHNISLEDANRIRYSELYIRALKREAQRNANYTIRNDLHF